MKNWLKVLVAVVLVLTCMFAYAACDTNSADDTNNGGNNDSAQKPGGDNTGSGGNNNNPNTPPKPDDGAGDVDEPIEGYKINFYYSYTALVTNENDRTQEKNERKLVKSITVPYENNGWEQQYLDIKDAISFNGYKFESWYPEWNEETQTGWDRKSKPQRAVGDPYGFDGQITDDINLYAYKGVVAGDDITWNIVYDYQTDAAIPPETLNEGVKLVTFMVLDKAGNILSKTALASLEVSTADGWTTELIASKDAIKFNSYAIAKWYTDWDSDNMVPAGEEYTFSAAPADSMTLYGVLGESDGSSDTTQRSKIAATLYLVGKGAMYDFANRSEVDVPWYGYRTDITNIVMDDAITYIGQNAFAGMTALKDVDFSENVTVIGAYAFYETQSKTFKNLRLPAKVETVGANAFAYTLLRQVILNDGIKTLDARAFYGSNKIKSIVIPSTITFIGKGAFHPGGSGSSNSNHALSKVYYHGDEANLTRPNEASIIKEVLFAGMSIEADNEWFNQIPSVYSYVEKGETEVSLDTLAWYFNSVDGVNYPAQYSYALKYKVSTSLVPIAYDYVPIVPQYDENGDPVFDDDGNPVFAGTVTEANIAKRDALMHEDGYGFVSFTSGGTEIVAGTVIEDDRDITCVRAIEKDGFRSGILGGGITWKLETATGKLVISPSTEEDATNEMWDVASANASGMLWYGAMNKVTNVKSIVIEEGVKHIGSYAFAGTGITEIFIPTSVTSIASDAFNNCVSLYNIYYEGANFDVFTYNKVDADGNPIVDAENNPVTGNYAAEIKTPSAKIYAKTEAPTGELGAYWCFIGDKKIAWTLNEKGNLFVGGDSEMVDFVIAGDAPWFKAKENILSLTVAGNITALAENLVSGYSNISTIKLHGKLKNIPESALEGTALLNNIDKYPNGLLIVDKILLKVDPSRRNTEFFATNTDTMVIADGAFSRCDKIKTVFISNTIQYINENAFDDSDIDRIFVDNAKGVWSTIAADFDYENAEDPIQMHYKGDWRCPDGVYVATACNHVFGEYVVVKEETCSTTGLKQRVCVFGDNCINSVIGATGPQVENATIDKNPSKHNFTNPVVTPPTCLEDGFTTTTCDVEYIVIEDGVEVKKVCGATNVVKAEGTKLTHTTAWDEGTVVAPNTCVAAGSTVYKCTGHDVVVVDGVETQIPCSAEKTVEGTKLEHSFDNYVDNGDGTETGKCTTCPEGTTPAEDTRQVQTNTEVTE